MIGNLNSGVTVKDKGFYTIVADDDRFSLNNDDINTLHTWANTYKINFYNDVTISTKYAPNGGNLSNLFANCTFNSINLDKFNSSNINNCSRMFYIVPELTGVLDLSNLNTAKIDNFYIALFALPKVTKINLSNWVIRENTSYLNFYEMLTSCNNLLEIDMSNWNFSKYTGDRLVNNAYSHRGIFLTIPIKKCNNLTKLNISNWNLCNATNITHNTKLTDVQFLSECNNVAEIDMSSWNVSNVTNLNMFCGRIFSSNVSQIYFNLKEINCSNWIANNITSLNYFISVTSRELIDVNMSNWHTPNLTSLDYFCSLNNVRTIDVSNWYMPKLNRIYSSFENCINLISLNLVTWDVTNVDYAPCTFSNCVNLVELNVDTWNLNKCNSVFHMVLNCNKLSSNSLYSIANMLPQYKTTFTNNSVLTYLGLMINNTNLVANMNDTINSTITGKGWSLAITRAISAQTLIYTPNGLIPVSNLNVGDKIYSYKENEDTEMTVETEIQGNEIEEDTITDIVYPEEEIISYSLNVGNNETIDIPEGATLCVSKDNGTTWEWIEAKELEINDMLKCVDDTSVVINEIEMNKDTEKRYCISLEKNSVYCIATENDTVSTKSIKSRTILKDTSNKILIRV